MPRLRTLALLAGDFVVILAAYLLTAYYLPNFGLPPDFDLESFLMVENGWQRFIFLVSTLIVGIYFVGRYENVRVESRRLIFEDLLLVFGLSFLLQAMVSYGNTHLMLSRWIMLTGTPLAILTLLSWRAIYSTMLLRVVGRERVLFLGDSPVARRLTEFIREHPERGYTVIGCADEGEGKDFYGQPYVPLDENLRQFILDSKVDIISVSGGLPSEAAINKQLLTLSMQGMAVESISNLYETVFTRVALETVTMNQLVFSSAFRPKRWATAIQDVFGLVISITGVLLTWPLMILTAIAVRLDSPGPALLRQRRMGKDGEPFMILKFRSMFIDADKRAGQLTRADKGDPRITKVGRFIRQTRLDELPQFFNVLRGEMALVGPRPEMPEWVTRIEKDLPLYSQRCRVKPGITGWAQLHHSPELTIAETAMKLEYDLYYIKNVSPALDLLILFHTLKAVILRVGAR